MMSPDPEDVELRTILFAAEPAAGYMAEALSTQLGGSVRIVLDERACQEALQAQSCSLLLIEEAVPLEHPAAFEVLCDLAEDAVIVEVNFGTARPERIVAQARAALQRRQRDQEQARASIALALQHELSASVTGLLLEAQLALREAGPELAPSLQTMVRLAESLSRQLRPDLLPAATPV